MDKMPKNLLAALDLEPRDMKVYTTLLEYEQLSIRKIAEYTHLNRGVTYNSLKKLVDLGLVKAQTQAKQLRYYAEHPQRLQDLATNKERELDYVKQDLDKLIPVLASKQKSFQQKASVGVYEGMDGISALLRDILNTMRKVPEKDRLIFVYASQSVRQQLYKFFDDYTTRRERYGIFAHVIAVGSGGGESEFSERKYLNAEHGDPTSYTVLYSNKMSVMSISKMNEPYGILIEDEGVVTMQKNAFSILWNSIK